MGALPVLHGHGDRVGVAMIAWLEMEGVVALVAAFGSLIPFVAIELLARRDRASVSGGERAPGIGQAVGVQAGTHDDRPGTTS
jgi:hypothetical protein